MRSNNPFLKLASIIDDQSFTYHYFFLEQEIKAAINLKRQQNQEASAPEDLIADYAHHVDNETIDNVEFNVDKTINQYDKEKREKNEIGRILFVKFIEQKTDAGLDPYDVSYQTAHLIYCQYTAFTKKEGQSELIDEFFTRINNIDQFIFKCKSQLKEDNSLFSTIEDDIISTIKILEEKYSDDETKEKICKLSNFLDKLSLFKDFNNSNIILDSSIPTTTEQAESIIASCNDLLQQSNAEALEDPAIRFITCLIQQSKKTESDKSSEAINKLQQYRIELLKQKYKSLLSDLSNLENRYSSHATNGYFHYWRNFRTIKKLKKQIAAKQKTFNEIQDPNKSELEKELAIQRFNNLKTIVSQHHKSKKPIRKTSPQSIFSALLLTLLAGTTLHSGHPIHFLVIHAKEALTTIFNNNQMIPFIKDCLNNLRNLDEKSIKLIISASTNPEQDQKKLSKIKIKDIGSIRQSIYAALFKDTKQPPQTTVQTLESNTPNSTL